MTDNEIIKALECCKELMCKDCPIFPNSTPVLLCKSRLEIEALDLIKRQQAEIERLTGYNSNLVFANQGVLYTLETEITKAKSEAIIEFAEKLKTTFKQMEYTANIKRKTVTVDELICQANWIIRDASIDVIDELLSEMTEGDNGA